MVVVLVSVDSCSSSGSNSSSSSGTSSSTTSKVKYTWNCIVHLCKRLKRAQIWITQCYLQTTPYLPLLPVAGHHDRLAGTHCAYPRRDGQAELTRVVG